MGEERDAEGDAGQRPGGKETPKEISTGEDFENPRKRGSSHARSQRYPTGEENRTATPPSDHPFRDLPNVVMSPHRAGLTDSTEALRGAALADLLNAAARGDAMPNRVDLARGY